MRRILFAVLIAALLLGGCAKKGEFDWLKGWDDCSFENSSADAYCVRRGGKYGFIDRAGRVLIEPKYDEIYGWADDFGYVVSEGKYGFVDNRGCEIVPAEYDGACSSISHGLGWLMKDGRYALVNENGLISDFIYEGVQPYWSLPAVKMDGKWGLVNAKGECPAGFVFDEIDTHFTGRIGEKYAALSEQGEILLPAEYDEIRRLHESPLILFTKDGVEGWLNTDDGSYVETRYHGLAGEKNGYVRCEWNGKTGFLDLQGNLVAEYGSGNVTGFNGEYALVVDGYFEEGLVNRSGEWVLEKKYLLDGVDRFNIVGAKIQDEPMVYYRIIDDVPVPISTLDMSESEWKLQQEIEESGLAWASDSYFSYYPGIQARWRAHREGRDYVCTPVAKDALVFVVNKENPVENLSADAIRRIYGGFAGDWADFGAGSGEIVAYQEDRYSVSWEMFKAFMQETAIMEPEWAYGPDGNPYPINYRNLPGAIGFCLYSRRGWLPEDVKIIPVDGIMPTDESIRSGAYPWTVNVCSIGEGKKLKVPRDKIEKFGFIPLK